MIGGGTGMAPFRGFLQERAALRDRGVPVAPSLLFFGCRSQETDLLYAEEMQAFQQQGLVRVENAFSRAADGRCRYVQQAMLDCADEVWSLLQHEAAVFVCGNASTIAPGVRASLTQIFMDRTGTGDTDARAWLAGLRSSDRFVEDIWGG
jgi:cytochrome P450 / NADPH-cytochrome P450 reductase